MPDISTLRYWMTIIFGRINVNSLS